MVNFINHLMTEKICGTLYLEISSSDIFNFESRIVQFCALLPSITERILVRFFPIWRKSSIDPSFCKKICKHCNNNSFNNILKYFIQNL
jgi:hypothetical protein